jgi:hypothetical protein
MEEVEIYEALLGFFLTLIITLLKNYIFDKKSVYDAILVGSIGWATHFAVRKILKRKFKENKVKQ